MGKTAERLGEFKGGERILKANPGLANALEVLDTMKCSDLGTVLMFHAGVRSEQTTGEDIIKGNHFNQPSAVSQRDFHYIDRFVFDGLPEVDFVDLSPLQPFGTSSRISGTNQKTIMPALRRSEVNADSTTALFREAYSRHLGDSERPDVRLATNTRITRLQAFDPKTGFLPHFRMFAQVTVGNDESRGPKELEYLVRHLKSEVDILDNIAASERGNIKQLAIKIGNIVLAEAMIDKGLVDRTEVRQRTQDPDFHLLNAAGIDMPETIPFKVDEITSAMEYLGVKKGGVVAERFAEKVDEIAPELIPRIVFDLGRVAGIGYYRHICYKIVATNDDGSALPLVDGGTTEWAKSIDSGNKYVFTATSGIGTELLAQHFLKRKQ